MEGATLMQYFKNENNVVYAYEDDADPKFITDGLTPITEEEAHSLLNPPLTLEQLRELAEAERNRLRAIVDDEIEWRKDAIDAEIATGKEVADLAAWKKYRVLLMRVDTAAPVWPSLPK